MTFTGPILASESSENRDIPGNQNAPRLTRLQWLIFGIYVLMVIIGVVRHEPWRDELRAFTISFHAHSPGELIRLLRGEGHPALWPIILKPFTAFPGDIGLKAAGLLTGIAASWVLFTRLELALWIRTGILFNYYWLFEYVVVSRNYAIGFLLTTLAIICWQRRASPYPAAVLLAIAANTHLVIALANLPLMAYGAWHHWRSRRGSGSRRTLAAVLAILISGYGLTAATLGQTSAPKFAMERLGRSLRGQPLQPGQQPAAPAGQRRRPEAPAAGTNGAEPPPAGDRSSAAPTADQRQGWRNLRRSLEDSAWRLLPPAGAGIVLAILLTTPSVALLYSLPAMGIAQFMSEKIYTFNIWHNGIYLMVIVYSLALCQQRASEQKRIPWPSRNWRQAITRSGIPASIGTISLSLFLTAGMALGLNAWFQDIRLPFSGAQAAASFLRERYIPAANILLYDSPMAESGISVAYAMAPLQAQPHQPATLLPWPRVPLVLRRRPLREERFCQAAAAMAAAKREPVAIVRQIEPILQPIKQPFCRDSTVHFFQGLRENVQIELIAPPR